MSLFRITCCEHVLVKIHCLQNQGRRCAWCRWTRLTPWLPPPRPPSSLIPISDHLWLMSPYHSGHSLFSEEVWKSHNSIPVETLSTSVKIFNTFLRKVSFFSKHQLKSLTLPWGRSPCTGSPGQKRCWSWDLPPGGGQLSLNWTKIQLIGQ